MLHQPIIELSKTCIDRKYATEAEKINLFTQYIIHSMRLRNTYIAAYSYIIDVEVIH